MSATSYPAIFKLELTPVQKDWASRYLEETRDAVAASVGGLQPSQWGFRTAADHWSIAEIIEHLVLVENEVHRNVSNIGEALDAPPEWEPARIDHFIVTEIPKRPASVDRSESARRFVPPPSITPARRWSGDEALALFIDKRNRSLQMMSGLSLRGRVIHHPVCGPWDGYQWLLAAAAHCARHTGQIREVKECPDFPA